MSTVKTSIPISDSSESTRNRVRSLDGTEIAYWTSGEGRPLLLVHGTSGAHERFAPLLPFLEPHAQVCAMDRRGRGGSGDSPHYRLEREFEDIATVIDAIAEASGSDVDVYGHSYGGNCVFGAAALTSHIHSLVLYEGWPLVKPELRSFPTEVEARMEALLAEGKREAVVETFMREIVEVSEEELAAIRMQPSWPARVEAAPTIARENRAFLASSFDPAQAAKITVPVLILTGVETPDAVRDEPETVAAALPDARVVVIEGQQHLADVLVPEVFAGHLLAFLRGRLDNGSIEENPRYEATPTFDR